jgi:hypothetical protein
MPAFLCPQIFRYRFLLALNHGVVVRFPLLSKPRGQAMQSAMNDKALRSGALLALTLSLAGCAGSPSSPTGDERQR